MKTILLMILVLLTGCAADMRCPPNGCQPFYLPPPAPIQFYPMPVQRQSTTTCTPQPGGALTCVTR